MTAEDIFRPVLGPDERLLWTGQPIPGPHSWDWSDTLLVLSPPAAVLLFSLALDRPLRPIHFWGPAVMAVVLFLVRTFYLKPLQARRWAQTFYAVSNQRVFIAKGASAERILCLPLDCVQSVQVLPSDKNLPNLVLQTGTHSWRRGDGSLAQSNGFSRYIAYLPDAGSVRDLIEGAKREKVAP
jgi:hypothetical protein